MQRNRNLRLSIRSHVESVLTSGSYGLSAFNVYSENDLRESADVVFPYLYLVDSAIMPTPTQLPLIAMEFRRIEAEPYEIGNRSGRSLVTYLHVFGKNRAQRDDIASMLQDYIGQVITVYDYTSGSPSADGTRIELPGKVVVDEVPVPKDARLEGTLLNYSVVWFTGISTV